MDNPFIEMKKRQTARKAAENCTNTVNLKDHVPGFKSLIGRRGMAGS
jgi:hypothetical protein